VTVAHNFVVGTLFAYGAIGEIVTISLPVSIETVVEFVVQLKWAILSFGSIFALVWPCTKVTNQVSDKVKSGPDQGAELQAI